MRHSTGTKHCPSGFKESVVGAVPVRPTEQGELDSQGPQGSHREDSNTTELYHCNPIFERNWEY